VSRTRVAPPKTASITTTEAAVLALLAIEGERSGYDLLELSKKAIGHVWTPARSRLYTVLPRLVEHGLARRRKVTQATRPDKHLYRITRAGRSALDTWLETVEPDARDAFYLKLFVGGLTSTEILVEQVEQFRGDRLALLERLREIEPTNTRDRHDRFHWYLLRKGLDDLEADVRWADWVLADLVRRASGPIA
jgi:PadR family transcriptional regulator, regulatory protein AphA